MLTYPQEEKKFVHSLWETLLSSFPISFHRALRSRLAALRSSALSLEKNFSIGATNDAKASAVGLYTTAYYLGGSFGAAIPGIT